MFHIVCLEWEFQGVKDRGKGCTTALSGQLRVVGCRREEE